MCLAIFKPAKVAIPEARLRNGWVNNNDGAGFAYIKKGKVVSEKGFMFLSDFLPAYKEASTRHPASPFVIHFRIRSMGDKSPANTHPFTVENGVMIHNGTIMGTGATYAAGPSDTAKFAETFGKDLDYATVLKHKKEFEDAIDFNKVVLLYNGGKHIILNEKQGSWKDDVWYSNHSFEARPTLCSTYSHGNGYHGMME